MKTLALFGVIVTCFAILYWCYPYSTAHIKEEGHMEKKNVKTKEDRILEYVTEHQDDFVYKYDAGDYYFVSKSITFSEEGGSLSAQQYFINGLLLPSTLGKKISDILWDAKKRRTLKERQEQDEKQEKICNENLENILTLIEKDIS